MAKNKQKARERFLKSPAVTYARFCVDEDNSDKVPKYVRLQAQQWLKIVDEEVEGAYIDLKEYKCICKVLKLMQFPDNINKTIYDVFAPWSWLLIVASLCTFDDNDNCPVFL
ncbi:MAG: terminase, partial [Clostridium baratii]|nr:terminase [Clostridium baratii]